MSLRRVKVLAEDPMPRPSSGHVPPEEDERILALWASPARVYILQYMKAADELGFDTAQDDILQRCVRAGHAQYERETGRTVAPYVPGPRLTGGVHNPVVYYMRNHDLVKIGTTGDIATRAMSIQPQGVMAVEFGSYDLERERHLQFDHLRQRGEWFALDAELGGHIVSLRETFRDDRGRTVDEWLRAYRVSSGTAA